MVKKILIEDNVIPKLRMRQSMKKEFKLFFLLAVIIVGMFAFASGLLFSVAHATYVEGDIAQDTVWTLTDSPFEVINNVTVKSGFTLTIEPGAEVRFGGNFSLIVEGKLTAIGTSEKTITFTSNKLQPLAGDWTTIKFINRTQSSVMAYTNVKYATDGLTVENGNVEIKNSLISHNLQSGMYVTKDNNGYVHENTIEFNKNGILISGNSSGTNIENNIISANTDDGIYFESKNSTSINNIDVSSNTLSTNSKGIHVFGQVSVDIVHNSISYNDVGVFYENATGILPDQYNDVYSNTCGMNMTLSEPINAEYNYWGDQSGPLHTSLNPSGKGNPAESTGADLDFIPFLSAPNGYINARPVARLLSNKALVAPNQTVIFFGTTSSDDRRVDMYFFDFGDGKNSSWTTLSVFDHKYPATGTYQVSLKVMDDFRVISNNSVTLQMTVQTLSSLEVSLALSRSTMVSAGQISIAVRATIAGSPVQNANIMLFSIPDGSFAASSGLTNSTGYFTTTFTAPSVTEQADFRITARASRTSYADGSDYDYLSVVPPLSVEVTLNPNPIKSEATSNGTVHVTYNANSIAGAVIHLSSDKGGSFTPQTGSTDADGYLKFTFKAPQTVTQLNTAITATATKSGYWEGAGQASLSVNPKTLVVQVSADPVTLESEATSSVIVQVTSDGNPVEGATVSLSTDTGGTFSNTTGTTDANGTLQIAFTAPTANAQVNITITASASRTGYVDGQSETLVTVNPPPTSGPATILGLPLTTLLLIIIPIVVVIIVVVLIKMKIISFSGEEPDES